MHAIVDDTDAEDKAPGDEAMRDHQKDRALHALRVMLKRPIVTKPICATRIGDELLHVLLHQGNERGVDNRDDRQRKKRVA